MEFRWRFPPKGHDSTLAIYGSSLGGQSLVVTLRGWQDSWLVFSAADTNEPAAIGPEFVSQAIRYGLENEWFSNQFGATMCIDYAHFKFSVRQNNFVLNVPTVANKTPHSTTYSFGVLLLRAELHKFE